jgi:hypothetical protein
MSVLYRYFGRVWIFTLNDFTVYSTDNLLNIKREAKRHFRNKKKEYLKDRINDLATNENNNNTRDLYIIKWVKWATNLEEI